MPSASDRIDFAPPSDPGAIRAFGLALLVHAALIAALTWGVNWKRSDPSTAFEAELWSALPQEAAPKLVEVAPLPPPQAPPKVQQVVPLTPAVDIALELEKEKEKKRKLLAQQEAQAELKAEQSAQAKRKEADDNKKTEAVKQAQQQAAKQQAAAAAQEAERQRNIARAMGLAGATGSDTAKGTAQKSSGPSPSYGGRVKAKVKPNIVFTEDIAGNPVAEVEVRTALDGTIMSQRLVKSSGNKAWDDAVVKAIIRTEVMPRDVDGRVPTPMILEFRPRD